MSRVLSASSSRRPLPIGALGGTLAWALALAVLITGCSALGGDRVPEGSRVRVGLYDAHSRVALELANQTHPDLGDAYSRLRNTAQLKLVPEEALGELLGKLDSAGFSRFAVPGEPPGSSESSSWLSAMSRAGERGVVHVSRNGTSRVFTLADGRGDGGEQLAAFIQMKFAVDALYQKSSGLQHMDNPLGRRIFEGQDGVEVRR